MEKETARIEAFSDAVFAIAITLLILDLHVPLRTQEGGSFLLQKLADEWPSYLAFTLSFFSIFIMWVNHHKLFKQIYKRNTALMFANGIILFLATCISYPTALLARYYDSDSREVVVAIYTSLFVIINLAFNLLWWIASRNRELLRPEMTTQLIKGIRDNYLRGVPIHLLAFGLSFFIPAAALMLCVGLWTYWAFTSGKLEITNRWDRKQDRSSS